MVCLYKIRSKIWEYSELSSLIICLSTNFGLWVGGVLIALVLTAY